MMVVSVLRSEVQTFAAVVSSKGPTVERIGGEQDILGDGTHLDLRTV